jgi:hypothetical protein
MYLGTIYLSTKFRPDRTSNMAAILKKTAGFFCGGHLGSHDLEIRSQGRVKKYFF